MNRTLVLLAAVALLVSSAPAQQNKEQHSATGSLSTSPQTAVIRGCLSGSPGNFTVTDQNGMQYKVLGKDDQLQSKVGHEVEISGTEPQAVDAGPQSNDASMAHQANSLQASDVRDVANTCKKMGGAATAPASNAPGSPEVK